MSDPLRHQKIRATGAIGIGDDPDEAKAAALRDAWQVILPMSDLHLVVEIAISGHCFRKGRHPTTSRSWASRYAKCTASCDL